MSSPATLRSPVPLRKLPTFRDRSPPPASGEVTATAFAPSPSSVLDTFSVDPIFSVFLSTSFDSTKFTSEALASGSAAARAEKLQEGIRLLEKQLRSEVISRHDQLLSQLSFVSHAHTALATLRSSLCSLQSALHRVRSELSDPHREIEKKTIQVSNLHGVCELLQSSIRVMRLTRKLRDQMPATNEPERLDFSKAAQLYREILDLSAENDLAGIDAIDEELVWVSGAGKRVRSEAMSVLERGLEGLNQADVATGLQVFYNLGELKGTMEELVSKYKGMVERSLNSALDMKAISGTSGIGFGPGGIQRSGTPQIGSGAKAKEALWQRLKNCTDELHSIVIAVWHLQRVLSKKKDPFTLVLLLDEVLQESDPLLTDRIWEALVNSLEIHMKSAFAASSFVKEIFTMGYPKLLWMMENFLERILRETDVKGVIRAVNMDGKERMLASIEIFQTAFLSSCLSRLSDLVSSVFPGSTRGSVPSKEQVSKIIFRIQEEFEAVQPNDHLSVLVAREAGKVLLLLAERAEYQLSTGSEARQVTGPATPAQLKNFALYQHLQEIHMQLSSSLPPATADVLSPSLGSMYGIAYDSVSTLFQAMLDRLEACILQIHDQNFGLSGIDAAMDNNASPYMEELKKSLVQFRGEFLSRLLPPSSSRDLDKEASICTKLVRSMASRVLIFFIRHASLVRPLSESGKLRMAKDMAELELSVGQNLHPVQQLGAPYRSLRAFRPILFLDTSQIGESHLLQDLPPSAVLHHLYSRGPEDLQSPLQRNKLTPLQYSLWLDSHTELDVWRGIKATLMDYESRARGNRELHLVYSLMLRLGSTLTEGTSASIFNT